jgi:hypothetical protein
VRDDGSALVERSDRARNFVLTRLELGRGRPAYTIHEGQEVRHDGFSALRCIRLGVVLNAEDRKRNVPNCHHRAVICPSVNQEMRWQGLGVNGQRMVSRGKKR